MYVFFCSLTLESNVPYERENCHIGLKLEIQIVTRTGTLLQQDSHSFSNRMFIQLLMLTTLKTLTIGSFYDSVILFENLIVLELSIKDVVYFLDKYDQYIHQSLLRRLIEFLQ